jgi:hypothetical protein
MVESRDLEGAGRVVFKVIIRRPLPFTSIPIEQACVNILGIEM